MAWDTSNQYFSGQGIVLLARRDAVTGKPMGFTPIGNVSNLKISIALSTIEHKESQTGQRAIDLRLTTETKASLSMTVENFISQNLADSLRGQNTVIPGGTVADELVAAYSGKIMSLARVKVSAVTVKNGTTTLVAGTDYTVNTEAGSIKLLPGLIGFVDGGQLKVSYTFAAQTRIDALTDQANELYMRFEGLNTAQGNAPVVVEIFKFLTDPLKELSLIGDAIQQFTLDGSVLADPLQLTGSKFFKVTQLS